MKFTSNGVEWHGFQHVGSFRQIKEGHILVVAFFDGEPELWLAENADGIESLKRYYRHGWSEMVIPFVTSRVVSESTIPVGSRE
jgi:hypothetical protein